MNATDLYHITIIGMNPHDVAASTQQEENPFFLPNESASVAQSIRVDEELVGGIVEVWAAEHLTPAQEQYLSGHPNVIDVRHVWPE
jgi:hypothetical protein